MYCPNCAAPIEGMKFCRACGANVSLVPQALTGQLSLSDVRDTLRRQRRGPSIEKAVTNIFTGLGFIAAALAVLFYFPAGWAWGWSFFFPAFACIGKGVGMYMQLKQQGPPPSLPAYPPSQAAAVPPAQAAPQLSAPTTSSLHAPSSVTEGTTRHLDAMQPKE